MQAVEQQLLIREEQIIRPLVKVLDAVTPLPSAKSSVELITPPIKQSLDELFPEQKYEEKDFQKAKDILGDIAKDYSPEQLKDVITEVKFLCESWLNDYERETFNGLTLQELLHEKGGL